MLNVTFGCILVSTKRYTCALSASNILELLSFSIHRRAFSVVVGTNWNYLVETNSGAEDKIDFSDSFIKRNWCKLKIENESWNFQKRFSKPLWFVVFVNRFR